jgi:nitroimidazol reductase NimA-like FMN-containing flavoprotein (pyridoxamine 5'-phosphate oxidase superfamily)
MNKVPPKARRTNWFLDRDIPTMRVSRQRKVFARNGPSDSSKKEIPTWRLTSWSLLMVRMHKAMPNAPGMDESEVDIFLSTSKTPLRLGTVDSKGDPMIHPVWFHYSNGKLYLMSIKENRKVRNIRAKKTVYFSIDTDAEPHKGVKGKGTAVLLTDAEKSMAMSEKLVTKYLGDLNTPMAKRIMDGVMKGSEVIVEITPLYFSTWDYSKMKH